MNQNNYDKEINCFIPDAIKTCLITLFYLLITPSLLLARTAAVAGFSANCDRRQGLRIAVDNSKDIVSQAEHYF